MSNLDKEFNKRFQYEKSSSDDFEVENLWAAIENKLDEEVGGHWFLYYAKMFGILILLLVVGGTSYWFGAPTTEFEKEKASTEVIKNSVEKADASPESFIDDKLKTNPVNINSEWRDTDYDPLLGEKSFLKINKTDDDFYMLSEKKETTSLAEASTENYLIGKPTSTKPNSQSSIIAARSSQNENNLKPSNLLSVLTNEKVIHKGEKKQLSPIQFLESKKIIIKGDEQPLSFDAIKSTELFPPKVDDPTKNISFALGVTGGVNWSNKNYTSTNNPSFAELNNETESGEIGLIFGLEAILTFKDRWIIQSGLEYNKFWSKFEYTDIQTEQILKEDQLTTIWVDGIDTLNVAFGDVSINRTSEREVRHHNQFAQISIPLEFGFKNRIGKFIYGTTVGASFNFLLNQSGKRLDEVAGIVEYNTNSETAPIDNFTLGLRISPFMGYHLSEKIILGFKPNLSFQHFKENESRNFSTNLQQIGLRVGAQFGF